MELFNFEDVITQIVGKKLVTAILINHRNGINDFDSVTVKISGVLFTFFETYDPVSDESEMHAKVDISDGSTIEDQFSIVTDIGYRSDESFYGVTFKDSLHNQHQYLQIGTEYYGDDSTGFVKTIDMYDDSIDKLKEVLNNLGFNKPTVR